MLSYSTSSTSIGWWPIFNAHFVVRAVSAFVPFLLIGFMPPFLFRDLLMLWLRRLLKNGGTVLHNMAGPTYNNQAGTDDHNIALPLYKDSFGSGSVDLETLTGNLEFPSYLVVAKVPSQ